MVSEYAMPSPGEATPPAVNKRRIIKQLPLFAGLTEPELGRVAERARLMDVGKDEIVYAEGDPPDALYVVVTGRARIFTHRGASREETLEIVPRGDHFGVLSPPPPNPPPPSPSRRSPTASS